jgi:hypothetical protein
MERMGKEEIVAQFEVLFWSLYGETEKHHEHYLSRLIFKQVRPEHKSVIVCAAANVYTDSMPSIPSIK